MEVLRFDSQYRSEEIHLLRDEVRQLRRELWARDLEDLRAELRRNLIITAAVNVLLAAMVMAFLEYHIAG